MSFGERSVWPVLAPLAATVLSLCLSPPTTAEPTGASGSGAESAVWTPKEIQFTYRGVTALYTCDGLRSRVKNILLELGARHDVQVRMLGCTRRFGPERFPDVSIRMNVLQPAGESGGQVIPAHWQKVDVLGKRAADAVNAAADCELIRQIKERVLPLFAARDVDYSAICQANNLLVGATRLKAEVLVAEAGTAGQRASR